MEKDNLLEFVRDITAKLLNEGLSSCYKDILYLFENYADKEELQYIIFALEEIKQTTSVLNLKIKDYKLNKIISLIDTPSFLIPQSDGFIHLDMLDSIKPYYSIPENLIPLIIFDNLPNSNIDIVKVSTEKIINDKKYINYRTFKIDEFGRVIQLIKEEDIF
jgi:hypothetical protein